MIIELIGEDIEPWTDFESKECLACKQDLPLTSFYNIKRYKDGKDYYCRECRLTSSIRSQKGNSKRCSLDGCDKPNYAKTYCRTHYTRLIRNGTTERITEKNSDQSKLFISYKYKLDHEWYEYKLTQPCDMCHEKSENMHIDHDHSCCMITYSNAVTCGECVRGMVCASCNHLIGHYENGTIRRHNEKYQLAKEYLEKYEQKKDA